MTAEKEELPLDAVIREGLNDDLRLEGTGGSSHPRAWEQCWRQKEMPGKCSRKKNWVWEPWVQRLPAPVTPPEQSRSSSGASQTQIGKWQWALLRRHGSLDVRSARLGKQRSCCFCPEWNAASSYAAVKTNRPLTRRSERTGSKHGWCEKAAGRRQDQLKRRCSGMPGGEPGGRAGHTGLSPCGQRD